MLGRAISHTINLLNPELIIIGGQLANAGGFLLDPLLHTARRLALSQLFTDVRIECSKLGPLSASLGAANIAVNDKIFSL
jgi:predicted NBD/HSP70 family sugar kinase